MKSLNNFVNLPRLEYLYLSSNRIQDINEIEKMDLPSILEVTFVNNSICRKQLYRMGLIIKFPTIESIDERSVSLDERQRAQVLFMQQCMLKEDQAVSSIKSSALNSTRNSTIKINCLTLDAPDISFQR